MHGNRGRVCNCYVAQMNEEDRFSIRFGAHALDCPKYRKSLDPVDRLNDEDVRAHFVSGS